MVALDAPPRAAWPALPFYDPVLPDYFITNQARSSAFDCFQCERSAHIAPSNAQTAASHATVQASTPSNAQSSLHQWPWRGFAFCSDLGTVGYLVNKPKLGALGWLIALPYYLYSLAVQPKGEKRKEELLYQLTANGIFPFAGAKLGTLAGSAVYQKLARPLIEKYPGSELRKLSQPMYKLIFGLATLVAFTPLVGDPASHWLIRQLRGQRNVLNEGQSI